MARGQTVVSFLRPRARRALMVLRPSDVFIFARKPCFLTFLSLLLRLLIFTSSPLFQVSGHCSGAVCVCQFRKLAFGSVLSVGSVWMLPQAAPVRV